LLRDEILTPVVNVKLSISLHGDFSAVLLGFASKRFKSLLDFVIAQS